MKKWTLVSSLGNIRSVWKITYSIKIVDNPHFTVIILQVVLDAVLFHVRADIFLHALPICFLELVGVLQHNVNEDQLYTANQAENCMTAIS